MHAEDDELEMIRRKKIAEAMKPSTQNKAEAISEPVNLTDADFSNFIKKHPNVIVDFWAAWCGPCRTFAPVFQRAAKEYAGKIVFGKLNVDENPATAEKFGVNGIPTVLAFKNGKLVERFVGAMPYPVFVRTLKEVYGL
ncbi:MAG: thioredoxin [Thermoplasmata archaeon]|nr:thioredoxin [Thermoplasmata archaeon]